VKRGMLLAVVLAASTGIAQPPEFGIQGDRVRAAIARDLRLVEGEVTELEIGTAPVSRVAEPELTAVRRSALPGGRVLFRMRCRLQRCLPFYASARVPAGSVLTKRAERPGEKPLLRANDRAMLRIVSEGMRISVPIVCLEDGRAGETIKVRTADTRDHWRAVVAEAGQNAEKAR